MAADNRTERTDNSNKSYSLLATVDFNKIVLPSFMTDLSTPSIQGMQGLILCPRDYSDQLNLRIQSFALIQQKIKKAGLTSDQEKQLHVAI